MANKSVGLLNIVFGADLRGFDRAMKKAQKGMKKFGSSMKRTGANLSRSLTLPILLAAGASVKMASDMEESTNKVRVAFGKSSDEVEKFANTTLEAFGIAKADALEMSSLFGDMGTALGFSQGEAAGMSQTLVGLAGDLASFKNIGVAEAQTALVGIFTGETESLKRLGIMTTEATLKNSDYFLSLNKTWKELTNNEKIQVRYNAVMEQTANAQGDFSRTSEGFANQLRVLQGNFKDLGAEIGEIMLPMAVKIIKKVKDWVAGFRNLDGSTKKTIVKIALLAAVLGPALMIFGQLAIGVSALIPIFTTLSAVMTANPIGVLVVGIAALVGAFYWLITSSSDTARTIRNAFIFMANGVISSINLIISSINLINPFKQIKPIKQFAYEAKEELKIVEEGAKDAAKEIEKLAKGVTTTTTGGTTTTGETGRQFSPIADIIETDFLFNMSAAEDSLENLITNTGYTFKTIEEQAAEATQKMVGKFQEFADKVKRVMSGIGDVISATNEKEQAEFDIWKEDQTEKVDILDGQMERELERVEESNMSDEEKANRKIEIEEEYADKKGTIDDIIDNKERAMKRKQAIRDKGMKIASAIMSTAEAVASVIANPILAAIVGALGAVQVATIASTPIPFEMGGLVSGPTLGLIGEGSGTSAFNPEVVSPLDKLMQMMGTSNVNVHGRIQGDNIVLVSDKAEISRQRFI